MSAARKLGWERAGMTVELRRMALTIARAVAKRVPRNVRLCELEQAALGGLWDGLQKSADREQRDPRAHHYYLKCRIRGAILDELRAQDWLPRRTRQGQSLVESPIRVLFGDDAAEFSDGSHQRWEDRLPDRAENQEARLLRLGLRVELDRAMATLPWRMQRILRLHYQRGVKFLHIAHELGVSEPRISQLHARAIERLREALKNEEEHEHRGIDRGAGDAPEEDPGTGTFPRRVSGGGLGRSAAAAADRPSPGGAGGAELHRAPSPRPRGARAALRVAGAVAEPCDGGVAVSAPEPVPELGPDPAAPEPDPAEPPVPSVLPVEGLDLQEEVARYRWWLIQQAMLQAGGSQQDAARLLGLAPSSLNHALRVGYRRRIGARAAMASQPPVAPLKPTTPEPPSPAPEPAPARAPTLADRIDWARVAELRARGLSTVRVAQKISFSVGAHWVLVEKALKQRGTPEAAE